MQMNDKNSDNSDKALKSQLAAAEKRLGEEVTFRQQEQVQHARLQQHLRRAEERVAQMELECGREAEMYAARSERLQSDMVAHAAARHRAEQMLTSAMHREEDAMARCEAAERHTEVLQSELRCVEAQRLSAERRLLLVSASLPGNGSGPLPSGRRRLRASSSGQSGPHAASRQRPKAQAPLPLPPEASSSSATMAEFHQVLPFEEQVQSGAPVSPETPGKHSSCLQERGEKLPLSVLRYIPSPSRNNSDNQSDIIHLEMN